MIVKEQKPIEFEISVECRNQKDADLIAEALEDKETKALVIIVGILQGLPSKRAQKRVVWCAMDYLDEEREQENG